MILNKQLWNWGLLLCSYSRNQHIALNSLSEEWSTNPANILEHLRNSLKSIELLSQAKTTPIHEVYSRKGNNM